MNHEDPFQAVVLAQMPQLIEAKTKRDDWTGVTDAAARRRIQTRLNMRAMRRRKAKQVKSMPPGPNHGHSRSLSARTSPADTIPCWDESEQRILSLSSTEAEQLPTNRGLCKPSNFVVTFGPTRRIEIDDIDHRRRLQPPSIPNGNEIGGQRFKQGTFILPLSPDHLIPLLQYNALRAMWTNRQLLMRLNAFVAHSSSTTTVLTSCTIPSLKELPESLALEHVPPCLLPTHLQLSRPKRPFWIDLIPHPGWRDNLLLAEGTFNAWDLWHDTIGGLFKGFPADEIQRSGGIVAWSPPWDASGWELSEGFWNKWRWSFIGCEEEVLAATNRWRRLRGEEELR